MGLFVNAMTIAFASNWFNANVVKAYPPEMDLVVRLTFILAFEVYLSKLTSQSLTFKKHLVFLVRLLLRYVCPAIPNSVQNKVKRDEYFDQLDEGGIVDEPEKDNLLVCRLRDRVKASCFGAE